MCSFTFKKCQVTNEVSPQGVQRSVASICDKSFERRSIWRKNDFRPLSYIIEKDLILNHFLRTFRQTAPRSTQNERMTTRWYYMFGGSLNLTLYFPFTFYVCRSNTNFICSLGFAEQSVLIAAEGFLFILEVTAHLPRFAYPSCQ